MKKYIVQTYQMVEKFLSTGDAAQRARIVEGINLMMPFLPEKDQAKIKKEIAATVKWAEKHIEKFDAKEQDKLEELKEIK